MLATRLLVVGWFMIAGLAFAGTPDGLTPSKETVCEEAGLKGKLLGICRAYAEAQDCDSPSHSNKKSCEVLARNFERLSGGISIQAALRQTRFSISSNVDDPLLLRADTHSGERIEFYGARDADGLAQSLDLLRIEYPDKDPLRIRFDDSGRPVRFRTSDGFVFTMTWISDTQILIAGSTPDGSQQVNVSVDLTNTAARLAQVSTESIAQTSSPLPSRNSAARIPLTLPEISELSRACVQSPNFAAAAVPLAATASGADAVSVTVQQCAAPLDTADVEIFAYVERNADASLLVPATLSGPGTYTALVPTQASTDVPLVSPICDSLIPLIGNTCEGLGLLDPIQATNACVLMSGALAVTPAAGLAPQFLVACESALLAGIATCETVGYSPVPGAPSIGEKVCTDLVERLERQVTGDVTLTAFVQANGLATTDAKTASATGPYPDFAFNLGGEPEIEFLITSPVDPAPGQGYVAEASLLCVPPSTDVTMSIVGTDGYADSSLCTLSGSGICLLYVPGAEEGVVDTVTVEVDGGPSRTTYLVF